MKRLLLVSLLMARPVVAGYAARDLVFPIIGRASSANGQTFTSSLWITNVSQRPAIATMAFLESGHANPSPRRLRVEIAPGATRVFDPLDAPLGAVRIESNVDLVASARISTSELAASCAAVPARFAIGNGQSTVLHGYVSGGGQYKLYVVEISGQPLAYTVTVSDAAGRIRAEKRLYVDRGEEAQIDLTELFPRTDGTVVKIEGINGSGKIIALAMQRMPGTRDFDSYEMSFPAPPRFAMSWVEGATYVLVAVAAIAAALIRR
jgi:hypothetical protein